jgi:cyanophycinase
MSAKKSSKKSASRTGDRRAASEPRPPAGNAPATAVASGPHVVATANHDGKPPQGALVIIGGKEDKEGERQILKEVVARARKKSVVIATISSGYPREQWTAYSKLFKELQASDVSWLDLEERGGAYGEKGVDLLAAAGCVFFTGGDQVRITSRLGGTPLDAAVRELYHRGGVVAGTSAGASAMSEVMLIGGQGEHTTKIRNSLHMAPGLGLLPGVIIDQHFAERGRLNRLVGAVAQNPRMLGIGLDENTAIVVERDCFQVMGSGSVYVVDALGESYTNLHDAESDEPMTIFDLKLHILSAGSKFDLAARRPGREDRGKKEVARTTTFEKESAMES